MSSFRKWFRVLFVVALITSGFSAGAQEASGRIIRVGVVPEKMRFAQEWIGVVPGELVTLELSNSGRMQHNLVVCRPGKGVALRVAQAAWLLGAEAVARNYVPDHPDVLVATSLVNPGTTGRITFSVPVVRGDYPFVCTLPGHAITMKGILHVGDPGDSAPEPTLAKRVETPASAEDRAKQKMQLYRALMDSGPALAGIISVEGIRMENGRRVPLKKESVNRGIVVRAGDHREGAVLFDTELLRFAAGWLGEPIRFLEGREDERAEYRHQIGGPAQFVLQSGTGWASESGDWADPRQSGLGQMPKSRGRYLGRYLAGERVIFRYRVNGVDVLDCPWLRPDGVFTRDIRIEGSQREQRLRIAAAEGLSIDVTEHPALGHQVVEGFHEIVIGAREEPLLFQVAYSGGESRAEKPADLDRLIESGNKGRAGPAITTEGIRATDNAAYVVDTLTLPYENPWNSILYTSGLDFFSNGDAALCTSHGDVWVVRGIDDDLKELRWTRFASGLANPLGLKIVDDVVHVAGLHEITRLHDFDGDLWADFYESFNADCEVSDSHHRFVTDLQTDSQGNFYYLKCSDEGNTAHGGSLVRVSADGQTFELFATGLRNPNGMGMGPGDLITFGKQQGTWIPTSGIHVVERGRFYGYMPSHHRREAPTSFEPPICWIPHGVDNSSAGQVWVPPGERWGPLVGQMLHFSYGTCHLFLVLQETVDGVRQGGVIRMPGIEFESGAMRGRFRSQDGQLYVTGLRGWQTSAAMPGCLQRVRYTGRPVDLPNALRVEHGGVRLSFPEPLNPVLATDASRYQIQQWQYRWTANYGSPEFKVSNPEERGRDDVPVKSVTLSADRTSVLLNLDGMRPVMQMAIAYNLGTAGGAPLKGQVFNTIHVVPSHAE